MAHSQAEAKEFRPPTEQARAAAHTLTRTDEDDGEDTCLNSEGRVAVPALTTAFGNERNKQAERSKYTFVMWEQVQDTWHPA
eukprot:332197-Pyramimonas_sp.AAC.1